MILRPSVAMQPPSTVRTAYDEVIDRLRKRYGDKFVEPSVTREQRIWFGSRVEVVSPCGFTRRGVISITTGWQPSLLLVHRKNQTGSWDLLKDTDIIVGWVTQRGKLDELPHDYLQVAVYKAQRGVYAH